MTGYFALVIFFLAATIVGVAMLIINRLIAPKAPTSLKEYPYECGVPLYDKTAQTSLDQKYYLLGLLLVLFDLEAAFVFPWAVIYKSFVSVNAGLIFVEMFLFLTILIFGFIYAWKKGALKWQ
ncbi:NADH-quinone oxidoreductase subunit A [Hydrogenothermus marinus]|uniref:NADH-quinone oxidoreductase subunit n=1 Tax=Hydrogenothermus marinus TaxID=133270 RepID=A0A3M0BAN3_9AQUI|nr:NADH-quinone oxidoreductase subunit A [Hydrogenothermus marinus]RMA93229.1 NADH-quinone oxidoreductase subunit A [Hydrogenothermus marinus]